MSTNYLVQGVGGNIIEKCETLSYGDHGWVEFRDAQGGLIALYPPYTVISIRPISQEEADRLSGQETQPELDYSEQDANEAVRRQILDQGMGRRI